MPNANFIPYSYNLYSMLNIAGIYLSHFIFLVTVTAVVYLIQDGLIKSKRMGIIFNRLPVYIFR